MARILITSGPTRQYLDPVRYLTNASSGRMGAALAQAAVDLGHNVVVVSGPVHVEYPSQAEVHGVVTTDQMFRTCARLFADCDGLIGAAAPCDYRPDQIQPQKITKTGQPIELRLVETPDIVASLAQSKTDKQWVVGFALETEDRHFRAITKMQRKACDLMVLNGPQTIDAETAEVELLLPDSDQVHAIQGTKSEVARQIMAAIEKWLIEPRR